MCLVKSQQVKAFALRINVVPWRDRTPRTLFAMDEVNIDVCNTDSPVRGVLFRPLALTPFLVSKARGVLPHSSRQP
jgi:hypothetical protein